jgi:ABC-type ATPase involved in cell division
MHCAVISDVLLTVKSVKIPLCIAYIAPTWTVKSRDARRITAAEIKYMRRTAGYIWTDYRTNTQIIKE